MPYKIRKAGSKYCVHKENATGDAGETVPGGCHESEEQAKRHMRALYAAEGREKKELTEQDLELVAQLISDEFVSKLEYIAASLKDEAEPPEAPEEESTDDEEDMDSKGSAEDNNLPDSAFLYIEPGGEKDSEGKTTPRSKRHLPYKKADGSIDLPRLRNAISRLGQSATGSVGGDRWLTASLRSRLQARAKRLLENANKSITTKIKDWITSAFGWEVKESEPDPDKRGLMFWKESDGTYHWVACYSNNLRDRDVPPEIIASSSHKQFVEKVDKGILPYPELWLWHRPEYKFGKANWVAYDEHDDKGFALAGGDVDKGMEPIAESISAQKPESIRVSHGMPVKSIVRDPDDPSVIVEHVTAEVSPLPDWAAANMLTSFTILKEDQMPIPTDKKKTLIEEWGIPAEVLERLEAQNADMAKEAKEAGIQSKETAVEPAATPVPETPKTEVPPAEPAPAPVQKEADNMPTPTQPTPTVQEIAKAVSDVLNPQLTAIDQKFNQIEATIAAMQSEIKALKETDEVKITAKASKTPALSLSALMAGQIRSVIGASDAAVDGRSSIAKQKPEETKAPDASNATNLGFFVIDQIIKESEKSKES